MSSFNDTEEAFNFYKIATSTMQDGSFQLRRWVSNDKDLELTTNVIQLLTMIYPSNGDWKHFQAK